MDLSQLLVLIPIIVILLLFVLTKIPTHFVSVIGWLLMIIIAYAFFNTSIEVSLICTVAGIIQSFPVTLMTIIATIMVTLMEATGAIQRISVFFKTLAAQSKTAQLMTMNIGAGTVFVTTGAFPNVVLPPIMKKMGYSNRESIALPCMGFDPLAVFGLLGAPIVVFADMTGISLVEITKGISLFLPLSTTLIAFSMLYVIGRAKLMKEGFVPALIAGLVSGFTPMLFAFVPTLNGGIPLTGIFAGLFVAIAMLLYIKLSGKSIIDRSYLSEEDIAIENQMGVFRAFSPWIILIILLLLTNLHKPLYTFLAVNFAMPIEIIPGQIIKTRMLWNAYTWTLISTILSLIFLKPTKAQLSESVLTGLERSFVPVVTLASFFAIAYVMNNSGVDTSGPAWKIIEPNNNMTTVLAMQSANIFGAVYTFISAPLGLFGGFVGSTVTAAVAMFAKYLVITAKELHLNVLLLLGATSVGSGLATMISPGKLACASAVLDALGEEKKVAKQLLPISIIIGLAVGILCFILTMFI